MFTLGSSGSVPEPVQANIVPTITAGTNLFVWRLRSSFSGLGMNSSSIKSKSHIGIVHSFARSAGYRSMVRITLRVAKGFRLEGRA